jgi:hypothetical protein
MSDDRAAHGGRVRLGTIRHGFSLHFDSFSYVGLLY